jgi:hypothetical protein
MPIAPYTRYYARVSAINIHGASPACGAHAIIRSDMLRTRQKPKVTKPLATSTNKNDRQKQRRVIIPSRSGTFVPGNDQDLLYMAGVGHGGQNGQDGEPGLVLFNVHSHKNGAKILTRRFFFTGRQEVGQGQTSRTRSRFSFGGGSVVIRLCLYR